MMERLSRRSTQLYQLGSLFLASQASDIPPPFLKSLSRPGNFSRPKTRRKTRISAPIKAVEGEEAARKAQDLIQEQQDDKDGTAKVTSGDDELKDSSINKQPMNEPQLGEDSEPKTSDRFGRSRNPRNPRPISSSSLKSHRSSHVHHKPSIDLMCETRRSVT
ncbi:hypothetical protein BDP27DRAFT_1421366 [Rhodocollybia butyracea]|uniref:Uncharacterized protein n=1 Tax=Rhodocollybia butyracea TaxID=206335 RepID=A0A9P5PT77_9AGAR|nr:hypothetical protein BDP27DRAFT_1421366 [Rhodocollybia butyracea]